ncbi:YciC family protein [Saccharomonospora xinjiangensis]|uniref:Uncharacterized protein family (UPF0259) n=1 Tax=Saccharomonospora xinjiangensis XJ-54 TaxID=882086 RepID=I0V093_9PSEU|nr:YciC family protein [Saccharomonospora xinjiangensis]EID53546.1 Uncharacterized protein family (UPF0259) [Saccharomonospora xinjiangensis XJ-54]
MSDSAGWSTSRDRRPGVVPLRPLLLGEILEGAVTTLRRYAGVVFGSAAVVAIVSAAIYYAADLWLLDATSPVPVIAADAPPEVRLDQAMTQLQETVPQFAVLALITLVTQTFLAGLLTVVVGRAVLGHKIGVRQAWEELRPRVVALLGLTLVVTVAVMVGTFLFVVPGVWLYALLSLATPALVLERGRVGEALRRSVALVQGAWWRVFGVLVVAVVLTWVISNLIQWPFGLAIDPQAPQRGYTPEELLIRELGGAVARTVTVPFSAAVTALLYIDQRMRRENLADELSRAARRD